MHPLHDYVAKQLAGMIRSRRVVVWYDERGEFQPFVDEVSPESPEKPRPCCSLRLVIAIGVPAGNSPPLRFP